MQRSGDDDFIHKHTHTYQNEPMLCLVMNNCQNRFGMKKLIFTISTIYYGIWHNTWLFVTSRKKKSLVKW